MRKVRYFFEALLLGFMMLLFRIMPLDMASATGGWLGRAIGPRLAASRKALRNIEQALPDLTPEQHKQAIREMWDNLGRVMAEYPHLRTIGRERVTLEVDGQVKQLFTDGKPCLFISGHLANWEIAAPIILEHFGKTMDLTYRAPNNPWVDKLLMNARIKSGAANAHSKSREGGRNLMHAMRDGHYIGILIDQKYNEGVAVPFFGRPAMTNPVFVQLGKKFDYPLIPAQIERTGGARFKVTLHKPVLVDDIDTETIIAGVHKDMENWIRKNPGQWLWLHKRWESQNPQDMKEAA